MKLRNEQISDASSGVFITFEGGEGAGKSTHINFLAETLKDRGYQVLCLREPGGTAIGEKLRDIVLDNQHSEMTNETELFIYEAARAQIVAKIIAPALREGLIVLCDRFYDSTLAYQVYGRGLSCEFVQQANEFACRGIKPDRTILLSCGDSVQNGLKRATQHVQADRLEAAGEQFHARVNAGFKEIAAGDPGRIRVIVSADKKSLTSRKIFSELADIFPWMQDGVELDDSFFNRLDTGAYGNKQVQSENETKAEEALNTVQGSEN